MSTKKIKIQQVLSLLNKPALFPNFTAEELKILTDRGFQKENYLNGYGCLIYMEKDNHLVEPLISRLDENNLHAFLIQVIEPKSIN
jgi:hypothetical protein